MSTSESDPSQTETQESTPSVQRISSPEPEGEQSPQALWAYLRQELRTPLDAIIGYSELGHRGAITKIAHKMVEIHSDVLPSPLVNLRPCTTPTTAKFPTTFTAKWWLTLPNSPLPSWSISPPYPRKPKPFWQSSWASVWIDMLG